MKIAVTNAFLPSEQQSGVPYQVHHLANALSRRGHEVTVFTFSPRPIDAAYAVTQFPRPPLPERYFPFAMAYHLKRTNFEPFDVVHCHGDNYLLRTRRPIIRTFHGSAIDEFARATSLRRRLFFLATIPLEWLGAKMADHVVATSSTTRRRVPEARTIIPCGVDRHAFRAGRKSDHPTVLFVGTEGGRKRGTWLADTFKQKVLPKLPAAELRIVSERVAVEPGVRRYGRVSADTLADLYSSSWAFCLPSTYEGFGVPYIEAMAAGTAVVATKPNPGAAEVLADGFYGAYVSDDHLATALTDLLTSESMRQSFEQQGIERSRHFDWSEIAAQYEAIFLAGIAARVAR